MKRKYKFPILILVMVLLLQTVACGSSGSDVSDSASSDTSVVREEVTADLDYSSADLTGYTIGYVTINGSALWGGLVGTSFEGYAILAGADVEVRDAQTSTTQVRAYAEELIEEGVDALVIFGGDIDENAEVAQEAAEAQIPVFMAAMDVAESGRDYVTAVVGPDQYEMCEAIAAYVVGQNGVDADYTVVQISGVSYLEDYIQREAGFRTYMEDYENYDLSSEVAYANSSRSEAKRCMENFLTELDQIDIVMGYDDDLTMGAVEAIDEAGKTGYIKVYSLTGQADAIQAVIDGQIEMTVINRASDIGAGLVTTISDYFENGSVDYYQRTELTYITIDNAEDYLDKAEF